MEVSANYLKVLEDVSEAAVKCGRNPQEITLIAVSKTYPWPHIAPAYEAGCRHFGESRVQEALPKKAEAPADIKWHFIGTLQKNKVNKVIGQFYLIHSVDSLELAQKISQSSQDRGIITPVLLQIDETREANKHGLSGEEWLPLLEKLIALKGITLKGAMTIGPLTENPSEIRQCFAKVRQYKEAFARELDDPNFSDLSMGMSHDYQLAIQEGSTLVRIGTSIFGSRSGNITTTEPKGI